MTSRHLICSLGTLFDRRSERTGAGPKGLLWSLSLSLLLRPIFIEFLNGVLVPNLPCKLDGIQNQNSPLVDARFQSNCPRAAALIHVLVNCDSSDELVKVRFSQSWLISTRWAQEIFVSAKRMTEVHLFFAQELSRSQAPGCVIPYLGYLWQRERVHTTSGPLIEHP